MQATDKVQNDSPRDEFHDHRIKRYFKRFETRTATLLRALLICLLVSFGHGTSVAQMSHPPNAAAQSDAQKGFEKLKSLAGTWQGSLMGMSLNETIRVTSSGNAILHEVTSSARADNPITMFYVEGDRLFATHYCDAGNRPRLEGKLSPDGKTIEFNLIDIAGNTQHGYMGHIVFTFVDATHHSEDGSWTFPGKPPVQVPRLEYTRTK